MHSNVKFNGFGFQKMFSKCHTRSKLIHDLSKILIEQNSCHNLGMDMVFTSFNLLMTFQSIECEDLLSQNIHGLACRPSAGNLGASGAGPSGPHLRRACGWPFGPACRQGRPSPENEFWLFLALFGQFFSPIFFLSQIVISPYSNIF